MIAIGLSNVSASELGGMMGLRPQVGVRINKLGSMLSTFGQPPLNFETIYHDF